MPAEPDPSDIVADVLADYRDHLLSPSGTAATRSSTDQRLKLAAELVVIRLRAQGYEIGRTEGAHVRLNMRQTQALLQGSK